MGRSVLIGFAEALPAPEVVFSLVRQDWDLHAFCRPGGEGALAGLPISRTITIHPPERDVEASVNDLRAAAAGGQVDALLALDDTALWLVSQAFAEGTSSIESVCIANAMGEQAAIALDKRAQIAAAQKAGLRVPPTTVVGSTADIRGSSLFPAIVKPALAATPHCGRLSKGRALFLETKRDAEALSDELQLDGPALLQPLIAGTGEGVFGFATAAGVVEWSGHRRLRMMNPHGSGASACSVSSPAADIRAAVEAMVMAIGWRGPFMIEFLRDRTGILWFMELNGRMWGSMALARRSGYEYPAWAVEQAFDADFVPRRAEDIEGPTTVRHLGRDLLHLMHVMRGPRTLFHKDGWPSMASATAAVLRPGPTAQFYNYDPLFPNFFKRDAAKLVWRTLTRRGLS